MLTFNLKGVLLARGIDKPYAYLCNSGFTPYSASKLLNIGKGVNYRHLEKLCLLLYCTPSELFIWQPDTKVVVPETHPLNKLRTAANTEALNQKMKQLPLDKVDEVLAYLNSLTNQDNIPPE